MPETRRRSHADDREWLAQQFEALTTELEILAPSTWAESKRYLPQSVTPFPGFYRFEVAPYLKEIIDCLSVDSPIREVSVQKGVQIGATVGVLENYIGYCIEHVRTAPVMMVTADAELAKIRLEAYIIPMLQSSGLLHLIRSSDETNARKTGRTDKKIEWIGGGFLLPFGAVNANKLRSISIQVLLRDEIDGWPLTVGRDGDPIKLSAARTDAYESSRKVLDLSTPTIKGVSKIEQRFLRGDRRYYFVCCLRCGHPQTLRWRRTNEQTGEVTGIVWETDAHGNLIADSVRYLCEKCGHAHTNDDKTKLLSPEHGAQWRPTAEPASPDHRSYHISALYSPVGMKTWAACVQDWLDAWDDTTGHPRDLGKLQAFYNNVLGETFELRNEKVRFEQVSSHRRAAYRRGEIPNRWAVENCGSPVLLLTAAVDVHKEELPVAVFGWCRDGRAILVDYWRWKGDTEQLTDPGTWGKLRELIEEREYVADDGKRYRMMLTLIDSSYRTDTVYQFAAEYVSGVAPIKGRELPPKSTRIPEFSAYKTAMGTAAYGITVGLFKDRWSAALRRVWDGQPTQPQWHFNAPLDATDAELRELTVEVKREKIDPKTQQRLGFEWHRPSGAANELWDLLVYNSAALQLIAWDLCRRQLELEEVNWPAFWALLAEERPFFSE